jgi:hypothetical protein
MRLETQLAALRENGDNAVFLRDALSYPPARRGMYWMNWRAGRLAPGTLMARGGAPFAYPLGQIEFFGADCPAFTLQAALRRAQRRHFGRRA